MSDKILSREEFLKALDAMDGRVVWEIDPDPEVVLLTAHDKAQRARIEELERESRLQDKSINACAVDIMKLTEERDEALKRADLLKRDLDYQTEARSLDAKDYDVKIKQVVKRMKVAEYHITAHDSALSPERGGRLRMTWDRCLHVAIGRVK